MTSNEQEIQLDQRDIERMRRLNLELKSAQEHWDSSMKLILFDYIDGIKNSNVKLGIKNMDFNTGKMTIKIEDQSSIPAREVNG